MRATTLFALTIALVLGLGAAATAKYFGLLEKKAEAAPVAEKPPPVMILVAGTNLFKGHSLAATDVKVREARPEEVADYQLNRKDYLPAVVAAANYRIMAEHLEADRPLKVKHLEPQDFENLERRISPYMRTVNMDLPKARCAGGTLQREDRVDVLLTTAVFTGPVGGEPEGPPQLRTACIARDCRIVMKRNQLLTALVPNPDEVPFTIEANPYRTALITYAEQKGHITLIPRSRARSEGMPVPVAGRPRFSDDESDEYKDEDERVQKVESAEYSVSDNDLLRIFKLAPIPTKVPPPPPVKVVQVKGVDVAGETKFGPDGRPLPGPKPGEITREVPDPNAPRPETYEPRTYFFAKPDASAKGAEHGEFIPDIRKGVNPPKQGPSGHKPKNVSAPKKV
ncbi:MAG TPA: hypothetical protein VKD90_18890 [Gemmataceae bacterium]|nr:hypothetical protein [Gemmataceae bacterium]